MSRKKPTATEEVDVFDQAIADRKAAEAATVVQQVAASTAMPEQPATNGHAQEGLKKKYTPPVDPFGFENHKAGENRVQLLKSEEQGAWIVRFAHNPNEDKGPNGETYSKENPHPVLKMLKSEGYKWGFDNKGKGGWGKYFSGDPYGQDHIDARRVLEAARDMIGAKVEQGQGVSA